MSLSDLSVKRPIVALVAAILLCVVGAAAFTALPVRELPNIDPPEVSITTSYRGASAEVVETRITEVIERQIAGIQGVDQVNSASRDGRSTINITFKLDRDLDSAANDVRDAVSRVVRELPQEADPPEIAKADADASPVMILNLQSSTLDRLALADYADRYLVERFSTVPGVARVNLWGAQAVAMRIWLDADALAARGMAVSDVEAALRAQNVELPAGYLEGADKDFTVRVERGYSRPEDFAMLPIQGGVDGYVTRLGDVARIEEGPDDRRRLFRGNSVDQVALGVVRQSVANDLEISREIRRLVPEINRTLPDGVDLVIAVDSSIFTAEAIREVWITLAIALGLVALVNYLFLGTWRAAIIPTVVAPICVLATFIVLYPLGFSLNLLTLLALVLAIGLVVDDAIVVTENIQRRIDQGEPPVVAAQRGAGQVFFAVVATTLVLIAVFAPLLFLPGYIGRLFVELAAAIAAAVAFSALLALSLSPMLGSKLLRRSSRGGLVTSAVNGFMDALRRSYAASLQMLLKGPLGAMFALATLAGVGFAAFVIFASLPEELVPPEDRGRVDINIQGPEGAGFDYTRKQVMQVEPFMEAINREGVVDRYIVATPRGGSQQYNTGFGVVALKPWHERNVTADDIAARLNRELSTITGARVVASVRGPFQRGGGGGGGSNVDMIIAGTDYRELSAWAEPILRAARDNPGLSRVRTNYEPNAPRLIVELDREKAAALGVSAERVGRALETMFGSRRVTTYIRGGQEYDVLLQTDLEDRRGLEDLNTLYVRADTGALVPLASVVTANLRGDSAERRRVDRLRAITLSAELNPGYTIDQALTFLEAEAAKQPASAVVKWGGQARDLKEASNAVAIAFGVALLVVFLVLAAQFESFVHPAVIMLTVPLAACGGLFGLLMADSSLNIYSQIGLIILIGVAAKNGILIVEFANQLRDQGRSIREAVIEASSLRLRPILMTSIATAAGALPLVLWQGAGAGSRTTIGVVIFGGAIFATLLTLFIVPIAYNVLARFTRSPEWVQRQIEAYERAEKTAANDRMDEAAE